MSRDHADALLDQLLRELLGNDRPRDMTARILARATLFDRSRRNWWMGSAAAVAAAMIITGALFFAWPREYPEPQEVGVQSVEPGEPIERGTPLETGDQKGDVCLGGYVDVDVDPHTHFEIRGKPRQEEIALDAGKIEASITKKRGTFDVLVGRVDVHATGTKFSVEVEVDESASPPVKRVAVNVSEGQVVVSQGGGTGRPVGGEGNPSSLKIDLPTVHPPATTTAPATVPASAPAIVPATVPAVVRPDIPSTSPATVSTAPPEPTAPATNPSPATSPVTQTRPATRPATAPANARGAAANNRAIPPLTPNATFTDGSSQGVVVERNGSYFLRNGGMTLSLPKPDEAPNGLRYLPGDWVTVTWNKGSVTKVVTGDPPAGNVTVGAPTGGTRRGR